MTGTPTLAPARRGETRRVVGLVSVVVLVDVLFYSAITPLLPTYVAELGLSKSQAGELAGAYALGTLLASLPAGWLASRAGARRTLVGGLVLLALASVAFAFGTSFAALASARFVQGVAGAAAWAAGLTWLVGVAPRERRAQVIGTALGTGIAGAIGGPGLRAPPPLAGPPPGFSAGRGGAPRPAGGAGRTPPGGGAAPPRGPR